MSNIIPEILRSLGQTSESVDGGNISTTISQENLQQQQTDNKIPHARKRSRKTDPAACSNADLRPPADVSLSRISGTKNNSGGFIEIPIGTIPDFRNPPVKPTSSTALHTNPQVNEVLVPREVGTVESALVLYTPITSVEHFHAKLPFFHLCRTDPNGFESESVQTVFPFSTFKTYSSARFVRDLSSFQTQFASNNTKHTILATVYNPNGESVSSEKQGEQYVVKANCLIIVHPILKIRDTREFVAAIPIPRTGDVGADSQLLKRIVIARDTGIDSHVNIRVEESSVVVAEADKSSLRLLDSESKLIGKLTDFVPDFESPGTEQLIVNRENHGFLNPYESVHKLASTNLTTSTNNSALELNKQITTRYIKGVCAICDNCGISSQDLLACDRCKKPIKAPKLTNDPLLTNVVNIQKNRAKNIGQQVVGASSPQFGSVTSPAISTPPKRVSRKKVVVQECVTLCSSDEESEALKPDRKPVSNESSNPNPIITTTTTIASSPMKTSSVNGICTPVSMNALSCIPIRPSNSNNSHSSPARNVIRMDPTIIPHSEETELSPENVIIQMEEILKGKDVKGSHTILDCRSIRVGSYKNAPAENAQASLKQAFVSTLGIMFSLPHCVTGVIVKLCIPFECIVNVEGCWKKMYCLFVKTGPKHATWIRKQLGMGDNVESENYYCPSNGQGNQKSIVLLLDRSIKESERGVLIRVFGKTLNEIPYDVAHKKLIEANPIKQPSQTIPATPTILPINVVKTSEPVIQKQIEPEPPKVAAVMPEVPCQSSSVSGEKDDAGTVQKAKDGRKVLKCDWSIELMDHDLESLKDEVFINDQIIDFWLKYMKRYCLSPEDKTRTYIFSSFFYTKLTNKTRNENLKLPVAERRHARVASWTKKEDIFKYDFILVPIVENAHWILAVICFPTLDGVFDCDTGELISELKSKGAKARGSSSKLSSNSQEGSSSFYDGNDSQSGCSSQKYGSQNVVPNLELGKTRKATAKRPGAGVFPNIRQPCILIFDSLAQDMRNKIYATLREYLRIEYKVKKGVEREFSCQSMPGCMPRVPQQPNYCDCGVYLLQFAESFFSNPIKSFRPPLTTELKTWFHSSVTQQKRQHIYNCIVELVKKENPENIPHIPQIIFDEDPPTESQENVVLQNAAEDEDVDVSTDCESSTISTKSIQRQPLANSQPTLAPSPVRAPTPNTAAVVLDHNYIAVSKLEAPIPTTVKVETPKTVKSPPEPSSNIVLSTITNPVIQPPPPHLGICEPSKISLSVPALSIKPTAASTTENSTINTVSPVQGKRIPCYANANAPVKRDITDKISRVVSSSEKTSVITTTTTSKVISLVTVVKDPVNDNAKTSESSRQIIRFFGVPKTPAAYKTQNNNSSKIVGSQKANIAKSPSTPEPTLSPGDTDSPRPVREKKDSWKVKEMKSQGEGNHDKLRVIEVKSPHSAHAQSSNLSQHMMVPIANTMRDSVSKKVSDMNSVRKQHDQRSQSPAKKRSKMDTDKS